MPIQSWMDSFPDPVVVVAPDGAATEANAAFFELATSVGCLPSLGALFGPPVLDAVARAVSGPVRCTLPLAADGRARFRYRLSLGPAGAGAVIAVLADLGPDPPAARRAGTGPDPYLGALRELAATLADTLDLGELTVRIHERMTHVMGTRNLYVALFDEDSATLSFPRYMEDGQWKEPTSQPCANGLTEYILRTGEPLWINRDVNTRARELGIEPRGRPARCWLGVPIAADGEMLGVIAIQDYERADRYDVHDLQVLTIVAAQAAGAIRNTRLLGAARRAYEELSEAQARLLDAERTRSIAETAGALNHEINNPLAAIAGNAQLLLRRPQGLSPEGLAKIQAIFEAAHRIQSVTTKMASLIQAGTRRYGDDEAIVDLKRSVASGDSTPVRPTSRP